MKRQGTTELPRFAVGALAIAGASTANAATVQITFNGSYISTMSGNHLDTDFGNDGAGNLWVGQGTNNVSVGSFRYGFRAAMCATSASTGAAFVGSGSAWGNPAVLRRLVSFTFTDANIRGGENTTGWLDVTASASSGVGEKRITVNRLIFDTSSAIAPTGLTSASTGIAEWGASTVPEPSGLGLLALGAGGLLARRRRAMAA